MRKLRFKQFLRERDQLSKTGDEILLSVSEYYGVKPRAEAFKTEEHESRAATLEGYRVVETDDLVMNYMLAWKGAYGVSDYSGIVSPAYSVFEVDQNVVDVRYLHHRVRSDDMKAYFRSRSKGIIESRLRLYPDSLLASYVDLPDLPTQRAIADFLDRETTRIDSLIEKKQRLVELLGEKYKTEKRRLVFNLDNQSVECCASSVSWFPDLPSDWRFMRCAHIFNNLDYRRIPLSSEQRGDLAKIYSYYGASGIIDAVDDYLFDEDTILIGEDGANLVMQSTPIAFKASGKYWVNNHAHILTPRFGDFDYWIHALNQVPYEVFTTGSAQPKLTSAVLGNIRLPVPSHEQQASISSKIEVMGQRVNTAIEPIRNSIDRLKEYRSALITSAVTGQIDVSTYARSGTTDRQLDTIQSEIQA